MSYANRTSVKLLIRHQDSAETKTNFLCDLVNDFLHNDSGFEIDRTLGYSKASASCYDIYLKDIGLIPNYAGHVPGEKFKFGETFGNLTINAKKYMQLPKF